MAKISESAAAKKKNKHISVKISSSERNGGINGEAAAKIKHRKKESGKWRHQHHWRNAPSPSAIISDHNKRHMAGVV